MFKTSTDSKRCQLATAGQAEPSGSKRALMPTIPSTPLGHATTPLHRATLSCSRTVASSSLAAPAGPQFSLRTKRQPLACPTLQAQACTSIRTDKSLWPLCQRATALPRPVSCHSCRRAKLEQLLHHSSATSLVEAPSTAAFKVNSTSSSSMLAPDQTVHEGY